MSSITRRSLLQSGLALSASTLVSRSGLLHAQSFSGSDRIATELESPVAPRKKLLFDFGWKFIFGNGNDPARDLGFGSDQGDFSKTGGFDFAQPKFDDSAWRSLNLPHDWAVELPFVDDAALESHGFKPLGRKYPETSVGWYRRVFDIPAEDAGRRVVVLFDGAFRDALIFVNGCFVGRNDNGYAPFSFDLSDFLNYGAPNAIAVRMDASFGDGWFYEGAGIYRHVWLITSDPLHLGEWESYVRPEVRQDSALVSLGTLLRNKGTQPENASVRWELFDPEGHSVAQASAPAQAVNPDGSAAFSATAHIPNPRLWSPETPHLYSATVIVETDGQPRDGERISFGIRTIAFDVNRGFFLNGRQVKIKGTCNHQDHAGVGAALPDGLQNFRLSVLKAMGGNAVRTSHNMPTPEWVEACERMGMMMMCETRMMSSSPEGLAQLETMIRRYRNSPAVILWSMGNEEDVLQKEAQGQMIVADMVRRSHELDPTRLCTAAVNGSYGQGVSRSLDLEGINYNLARIDNYHRTHPQQPLIGSETASTVSTRGIYITDTLRNWVSAYDVNNPPWAELAEEWWPFYASREFLAGGFAWTGFDYRGEPTPYGWPSVSSQFGIVDTCGFPKDNFYYYKAWWGQEPVLHLFPHWNWQQREGEPIRVWVHSNLDEVELFLNGASQGRQKVTPLQHLEWSVQYAPGALEAHGYRNGALVLTEKRETTGDPVNIRLTADRTTIDANGEDIAILRVEALDAQGRPVPTADALIHFAVTGEGQLIGVGNGDPNCQESDKAPKRSLFNGLAQVIVQSTRTPGTVTVTASRTGWRPPKLTPATLTITTRKVELRPLVT